MKQLQLFMGMVVVMVLSLISCGGGSGGGGGGGGGGGQSENLQISAIDNTSVDPLTKLTITGTGFDTSADLTVSFFDDKEYKIEVPVLEATASSIIVVVPPYFNASTDQFETGTISVQVSQSSAGSTVTSNIIAGLQVGALPSLELTPGDVTANVAAFMELSLTDTINELEALDTSTEGQVDTVGLCAQLETARLQYGQLKDIIRNAIANPAQAQTIATINGVPITLDEESLRITDQLMVAIINGILAQLETALPAVQQSVDAVARSSAALSRATVSSICEVNPQLCSATGRPFLTVVYTRTGEEIAVGEYHYMMALPGASEILNNIANMFAAASATVGAVIVTAGASVPLVAVAAVTSVNVNCMVAKFGLDAARLSADATDKEAAKDLLDDFNGTMSYMSDAVLSPIAGAIWEKAGVVYDLVTGWLPVMRDEIPVLLSDLTSFLDPPPPPVVTGDVTGYWTGTINNPNLGRTGCSGGVSYFSVSLSENDSSISGDYGSVSLSGGRSGYALSIDASTRFGNRSYSWTWDGSDTITGSVSYFCWSDDTGQLLNEGSGTFSVTR